MPVPNIPEGFYWVRVAEYDNAPFVAQRFASTWFAPGIEKGIDGRMVEMLSPRIEMPVNDLQGRAILAHLLPKPARHAIPRGGAKRT